MNGEAGGGRMEMGDADGRTAAEHYCHLATRTGAYRECQGEPWAAPALKPAPRIPWGPSRLPGAGDGAGASDAINDIGWLWHEAMGQALAAGATRMEGFSTCVDSKKRPGVLTLEASVPGGDVQMGHPGGGLGMRIELSIFDRGSPFSSMAQWLALKVLGHDEFVQLHAWRAVEMCAAEEARRAARAGGSFPAAWVSHDERRQLMEAGRPEAPPKAKARRI